MAMTVLLPPPDSVFTGFEALAGWSGKVMLALASRVVVPERRTILAFHGPLGRALSRGTRTGSVWPRPRVVPRVASNGPAENPPGPSEALGAC